jgi:hypothetical protein
MIKPRKDDGNQDGLANYLKTDNVASPGRQMSWMLTRPLARRGLVATATLVIILGILIWISNGVGRLTQIITGSPKYFSTSMEPYDISLRNGFASGESSGPLPDGIEAFEWDLSLPKSFIQALIGKNGSIQNGKKGEDDGFTVYLEAVADDNLENLTPASLAEETKVRNAAFGIRISNERSHPEISKGPFCVRVDDFDTFMKQRGAFSTINSRQKCTTPRCNIYMHLSGWSVDLSVARVTYEKPDRACSLATKFLDTHTVKRDDIR